MTTTHNKSAVMSAALRLLRGARPPRTTTTLTFTRRPMSGRRSDEAAAVVATTAMRGSLTTLPPPACASSDALILRSFGTSSTTSGGGAGSFCSRSSSSLRPNPRYPRHRILVRIGHQWPSGVVGISSIATSSPAARQHRHRSLSSSSSSTSSPGGVEVEVTRTTKDGEYDEGEDQDEDEEQQQAAGGGGAGCCGGSSGVKSPERMAEERLMDLQHHIRQTHSEGRYDDALKASEALIEGCEMLYGKTHPATASAYNNAAVMHKLLGEYGRAADRYHDALRVYGEVVGKDHASYAAALNNLGNLLRTQAQLDPELSSFRRLQLNESAIEYLEEALSVRSVELGDDHPHTVTSRSNLGGALAAHVLSSSSSSSSSNGDAGPSRLTRERWEAAEDHLRSALRISIENQDKMSSAPDFKDAGGDATTSSGGAGVRTLPAASAAQNLAVFLKCRADRVGTGGGGDPNSAGDGADVDREDMYAEARKLYNEALSVRAVSLGDAHPDTVATRHSLAELLLSTGDEVGSDRLRRKILESLEEEGYGSEDGGKDSSAK